MKRHLKSGTPAYRSWKAMRVRCANPKQPHFSRYGGAGIRVCARWDSFENFLADMGERPTGCSIDRIDARGNYSPENCRWATAQEQSLNRTTAVMVSHNGKTQNLACWLRELNLHPATYKLRRRLGWSLLEALFAPVRKKRKAA